MRIIRIVTVSHFNSLVDCCPLPYEIPVGDNRIEECGSIVVATPPVLT
jgi:hypothetical protein